MKSLVLALVATLAVSGCAMNNEQSGRAGGAIVGAGLGAVLGDAVDCKGCALIGGIIGAMAGGAVGGNVGRYMDRQDAQQVSRSLEYNRTGQTTRWTNPDSGVRYDVTPTRTVYDTRGQGTGPCREVTIGEAQVGGKRQEVYGTACRQADGSWKLQQR